MITKAMLDAMPLPDGEPFPGETLREDGWEYRDLPRLSYEMFDKLVGMIGEENIRWLTEANYGDSRRGQFFISPKGIENLRSHVQPK